MYPSQMHPSEVAETPIYEEIGNTAKSKVTNKEDNADIYDENSQAHTNSQGHSNIKDRYQDNKHIAVAKPRKTPRNNKVIQETTEGYIQAQPKEYSV
uniref:Uncharacterized protein n=1 Tax=Arion vulgaris TaxID=1028688 RepID=A0A0B6Z962_9EUPU